VATMKKCLRSSWIGGSRAKNPRPMTDSVCEQCLQAPQTERTRGTRNLCLDPTSTLIHVNHSRWDRQSGGVLPSRNQRLGVTGPISGPLTERWSCVNGFTCKESEVLYGR
jgi:hypothetical protein